MSTNGETADLMVREGIQITESALKLAGLGAKNLAALLIALANDNQKLAGKTNLKRLIHDGEELTIFSVKQEDLKGFQMEAKRYGVLFYPIVNKVEKTGTVEIMAKARDAKQINRIFERFQLATVDMGSVKSEIERSRREKAAEEFPEPERSAAESDKTAQLVDSMLQKPDKEQEGHTPNPAQARTTKSPQSEPISRPSERSERDISNRERVRPSVRQELKDIKAEQAAKAAEKAKDRAEKMPATEHHAPKKKRRKRKER